MEDYTFQSVELGPDGKHMRSFFGVFDGHSGKKAAIHAKVKHLGVYGLGFRFRAWGSDFEGIPSRCHRVIIIIIPSSTLARSHALASRPPCLDKAKARCHDPSRQSFP